MATTVINVTSCLHFCCMPAWCSDIWRRTTLETEKRVFCYTLTFPAVEYQP